MDKKGEGEGERVRDGEYGVRIIIGVSLLVSMSVSLYGCFYWVCSLIWVCSCYMGVFLWVC